MNKEKLSYLLIVVLIAVLAIMILWYTFGHSPTVEQILTIAVVTPYVFVFGIYERLNSRINDNYEKLNDKISEIKTQLARIEGKK